MKKIGLFVLLAASFLQAQSTLEKCQSQACYGFGPPSGASQNGMIYQDLSQLIPAMYCAKNNAWVGCGVSGGGSGAPPSSPVNSIQVANSGLSGTVSDPNILIDNVAHQFQTLGSTSRYMAVTNPTGCGFFRASDCITNVFNDKRSSQQEMFRESVFGGPGGMNYGNGPGAVNLWTTSQPNYWTFHFNRRGITQYQSMNVQKRATGDFAGYYTNEIYGVGGLTGASDEGGVGSKINGGETFGYYTGTATAGAATGSTTLPITSGTQTCDGCFMYDASKAGASGHFTGLPTQVTLGTAKYWSEPIDTPVTPSTAYGVPVCTLPQLTDQTVPQTVACTVTGALGSTGVFVNGVASLSGSYAEQVAITVNPPSGGSQTVNVTYRNPHVSGQFILWQGGTAQGMVQVSPFITSIIGAGVVYGETVFGAPDSTHLAASIALGGGETAPDTNWIRTAGLGTITKSGTTATAALNDFASTFVPFNNAATAVISNTAGCTGGSMDGTITAVKVDFLTQIITWTDATASTGCTSGNIGFPVSNFAYQLYPYAEQIAAGDVATQVSLEPNKVPFASGDSLVEPHPPTFGYNAQWVDTSITNPNPHAGNAGYFHTYKGAGINSSFYPIRLYNLNACAMYTGCGGSIYAPQWLALQGPNNGTIASTVPLDPNQWAMRFDCMLGYNTTPFALGICTDTENVLTMPLGNITLDRSSGWNFTGAGLHITGNFVADGNMTSASAITGKSFKTTNLVSDAANPYTVGEQFNNTSCKGLVFGTFDSLPSFALTETGRICSGHDFSSNYYMKFYNGNDALSFTQYQDSIGTQHVAFVGDVATPALATQSARVLASTVANDLAYFDTTTGHLADSGIASSTLTTSAALTTNCLPKASGTHSLVNSTVCDNGTTVTITEPLSISGPTSIATGTASNTDLAGQVTLVAGAGTQALTGTYTSAPIVVCTDTTAIAAVKCSASTTTITIAGTGTDVINYIAIGRN